MLMDLKYLNKKDIYLVAPLLPLDSVTEDVLLGGLVSNCSSFSVESEVLIIPSLLLIESVISRL